MASIQIRGGGTRFKEVAGRYVSLDLSMGLAMGTSMDMTTQRKVKLKLTNNIEKSNTKSKQNKSQKKMGATSSGTQACRDVDINIIGTSLL